MFELPFAAKEFVYNTSNTITDKKFGLENLFEKTWLYTYPELQIQNRYFVFQHSQYHYLKFTILVMLDLNCTTFSGPSYKKDDCHNTRHQSNGAERERERDETMSNPWQCDNEKV